MDLRQKFLSSVGLLWVRLAIGLGIATHGYSKIFGGRMETFAAGVDKLGFPFPAVFAWAAALSELAGGICVALGWKVRLASLFIFATMSVAAFVRHAPDPFSVKEKALLYWAVAAGLILLGGGEFSLDNFCGRKKK